MQIHYAKCNQANRPESKPQTVYRPAIITTSHTTTSVDWKRRRRGEGKLSDDSDDQCGMFARSQVESQAQKLAKLIQDSWSPFFFFNLDSRTPYEFIASKSGMFCLVSTFCFANMFRSCFPSSYFDGLTLSRRFVDRSMGGLPCTQTNKLQSVRLSNALVRKLFESLPKCPEVFS